MRKSLVKLLVVMSIMAMTLSACGADATPTAVTQPTATTAAPAASTDATKAPETAATATTATSSSAPEQLPRKETLYIAGLQWQPPTNFNPLNGNPDWPGMGNHLETYETLFAYNQLSGELDPLLAKELTTVDTTTMKITLQDGTKWQDGKALTTDDVIYTYELAKSQSDINYNTLFRLHHQHYGYRRSRPGSQAQREVAQPRLRQELLDPDQDPAQARLSASRSEGQALAGRYHGTCRLWPVQGAQLLARAHRSGARRQLLGQDGHGWPPCTQVPGTPDLQEQ